MVWTIGTRGAAARTAVAAASAAAWCVSGPLARAADFTWTNNGGSGGLLWAPATNWSPSAGGPPNADDVAIFINAVDSNSRTINLGGLARDLGTLRLNESSSTLAHGFSNGSFVLGRLEFNGNLFRFWNTPVAGAAATPGGTTALTIAGTGGGTIDYTGVINTHDLNIASKSGINLYGNNTITGTLTLASHININQNPGPLGGGSRPIVFNAGGSLQVLSGNAGTYAGGVTVNANANFVASGMLVTPPPPSPIVLDFGPLTINGSTLTQNGRDSELRFGATTFTGNATFTGSGLTSLGAITGGAFKLTKTGSGELILREANNLSGGTTISGGLLTVVSPTSGLGSGPVTLGSSGKLRFIAPQATFPSITVPAGAALGGDLTGAVYSGAGKNVTLATDAILFPTAGPTPVRGVDVASAQYWLAPPDKNGSYVVGDAGTNPFKGAMIGHINPSEMFQGTISEAETGIGITVQYHSTSFEGMRAAFNTTNTASGVTFIAPQTVRIITPSGGTATVFTFPGDPAAQSKFVAAIGSSSSYSDAPESEADETLNVSHGQVTLDGQVAGTINVRDGGTLNIVGPTLTTAPTTGTFNILDGAMVIPLSNVSTFNFSPGSQVLLRQGMNTSTSSGGSALPAANADLVAVGSFSNALTFPGAGLRIGDGRRLFAQAVPSTAGGLRVTIGPDGSPFGGTSGGIHAAPGADNVTIAAATGSELRVTDPISMAGVQLQTNDTARFSTGRFNTGTDLQRVFKTQQGNITLVGDVTTGALAHKAGALTLGDGASNATYRLGDLSVDGGLARLESGKLVTKSVAVAAGAQLDLTDEKLIVTDQPAGTSVDGTYDGIQGLVQAGYHYTAWDGTGAIVTSQSDARVRQLTTLAVSTAAQTGHVAGTFGGVSVDADDVLVMYTYAGDVNLDGLVDGADYGTLDNWIQFPGTDGYANGDVNYDGVIDGADYGTLDNSIQLQGAPFPTGTSAAPAAAAAELSGVAAVPEPSVCGFAALATAAALLGRRRRRHCPRRES